MRNGTVDLVLRHTRPTTVIVYSGGLSSSLDIFGRPAWILSAGKIDCQPVEVNGQTLRSIVSSSPPGGKFTVSRRSEVSVVVNGKVLVGTSAEFPGQVPKKKGTEWKFASQALEGIDIFRPVELFSLGRLGAGMYNDRWAVAHPWFVPSGTRVPFVANAALFPFLSLAKETDGRVATFRAGNRSYLGLRLGRTWDEVFFIRTRHSSASANADLHAGMIRDLERESCLLTVSGTLQQFSRCLGPANFGMRKVPAMLDIGFCEDRAVLLNIDDTEFAEGSLAGLSVDGEGLVIVSRHDLRDALRYLRAFYRQSVPLIMEAKTSAVILRAAQGRGLRIYLSASVKKHSG